MVSTITQKILIIEEEADILELLSYNLSKAGFITEAIQDHEQLGQNQEAFIPQMVLLGNFPNEESKVETFLMLKSNPSFQNVRFVCLSTDTNYLNSSFFKDFEIDACIITPIKPRLLVDKINKLLLEPRKNSVYRYEA